VIVIELTVSGTSEPLIESSRCSSTAALETELKSHTILVFDNGMEGIVPNLARQVCGDEKLVCA
jgi:hypothetical protein